MKKTALIVALIALFGLVTAGQMYAQGNQYGYTTEMTMEEYEAELQKWQQREQDAQEQIEQLEQDIADLEDEISQVEDQIAQTRQETLELLSEYKGISPNAVEQEIESYLADLDRLISDLEGFLALSPEEMYQRQDEMESLEKRVEKAKMNVYSALDESVEKLDEIDNLLQRINSKMPEPASDIYTVMRGDYLWKISGKEDIYADPYQWVKIWSANRAQIDNPDLIFPEQKLDVPRRLRNNQHLVSQGEHLSKIAGYEEVYGNPFDWQKLYNANKKIISDPNTIYPHQILNVPE